MFLLHWNYFLALEDDLEELSRYIEFSSDNLDTYSIETARILMLASQEVDVLLKRICKKHGDTSTKEEGYRKFMFEKYPNFVDIEINILRYELQCVPFSEWKDAKTPDWWTANNKVKHRRDTDFRRASLCNAITAVSALLLTSIYFYLEVEKTKELHPNPSLLYPRSMIQSITPTAFGNINNYKLP